MSWLFRWIAGAQTAEEQAAERKSAEQSRLKAVLADLIQQYNNYKPFTRMDAGDWTHVNPEKKREIGDEKTFQLTILLRGPRGSGKSALLGTLCNVLGKPRTSTAQSSNDEGTYFVQRHLASTSCIVLDSRGQTRFDHSEALEEALIVEGHLRAGQRYKVADLPAKYGGSQQPLFTHSEKRRFSLRGVPHVVVQVVNGADNRDWAKSKELEPRTQYFANRHMRTVCIVTKLDLVPEADRKQVITQVAKSFGTAAENCYALQTYHDAHVCDPENRDFHTEITLMKAMLKALLLAELFLHDQLTEMMNIERPPQFSSVGNDGEQ